MVWSGTKLYIAFLPREVVKKRARGRRHKLKRKIMAAFNKKLSNFENSCALRHTPLRASSYYEDTENEGWRSGAVENFLWMFFPTDSTGIVVEDNCSLQESPHL